MKLFNHLLAALVATSLWAGCTGETEDGGGNTPKPGDGENASARQEIVLTLDNKLVPGNGSTTRADSDPIAIEAENAVDALDIFVFGSQSENGTYSYLERFAYRSDKDRMPAGATELELNAVDDKVNVVLNLKKGFFVRLYCVANQETLIDPANPDGTAFEVTDYVPINYTVADDGTMTVLAEGIPTEDAFKTFHTPLIDPAAAGDVLLPALPMSGGLITPLDLRDQKSSGRLTAGFRLTRSVARFDVRNNPELTRLTIESVTMANGRKGVTFFPIQVYGDRPTAAAGDLVTYPARPFTAEDDINTNYQTGAFYSYPCLSEDEASLLIKGKYQINQTESKEVVYTVPFKQTLDNDQTSTAWIEIQTNHRYTVSILDADEYHLQFSLSVADWNDEGSIDDYEPDNTPGDLAVNIPDAAAALVQYDADTKTVSMGCEPENIFHIALKTNSALKVTTSYEDNVKDYDWLTISEPEVKPTIVNDKFSTQYIYTVTPNADYAGERFPRATFRFMDLATGEEQILFVKLTGTPVLNEIAQAEWPDAIPEVSKVNEFDVHTQTASLFLIDDSQVPFTVTCSDEVEVDESFLPEYLEVIQLSNEGSETMYALKLKTTEITDIPDRVTVTLFNKNMPMRKQTITVKLLDASVEPSFASLGGTNVDHTAGSGDTPDNVSIPLIANNSFTVSTLSVEGVDVKLDYNNGSEWLTSSVASPTRAVAKDHKNDIKFNLVEGKLPGAKPVTVTLTNKVKGGDYKFTVTPKADKPVLTKAGTPSVPVDDVVAADGSITMYKLPSTTSTLAIKVTYLGGSKLSCSDASVISLDKTAVTSTNEGVYTLTALKTGSATLTVASAIEESKKTSFNISVLSPAITTNLGDMTQTAKANYSSAIKVTSFKGYTAAVTNWGKEGSMNGQPWFDITSGISGNGGTATENLVITVKANIASLYPIKPATITLTNKILNGGNISFTVNPILSAPTVAVVANTAVPSQNTFDASTKTIKLYKVADSQIKIKASGIGKSQLLGTPKSNISVTVATSTATDITYLVKLPANVTSLSAGVINDAFILANASDNTKQTKMKVEILDPAIKVPSGNVKLNLVKNTTASKTSITSPAGFTADAVDINWGTGGSAWFTLTTTNVTKDGSIGVKTSDLSSLSPDKVKTATVTLRNKIAGGPNATFLVEPGWMAPTANTSNASALNVRCYQQGSFTVNVPFGGIAATSANTSHATVTTDSGSGKVTYTGTYYSVTGGSQNVIVTVTNAKDTNKKITYTLNVQNLKWATGNLTANGAKGAKIGAPTEYGLLFKWGSLVGYDTSTKGDAEALVTPPGYSGGTLFSKAYVGNPNVAANLSTGTGDPCKVYLQGKWRMPTVDEYYQMGGVTTAGTSFRSWEWTTVNNVKGVKVGPNKEIFFPVAGDRVANGPFGQGSAVHVWSSTLYGTVFAYGMYSGLVYDRQDTYMYAPERSYGFSVRCVEEP